MLPGSKAIKLKGYGKSNPSNNYSTAKQPIGKWQESEKISEQEIQKWINSGGWIGATIPKNRFIIDVDCASDGYLLKELLEGESINHHCIKTVRGWQFVFKAKEANTTTVKQVSHHWSAIGLKIDTKPPGKGYIVFPTSNTKDREIVSESMKELQELPDFLHPVWNANKTRDYDFPLPMDVHGSRNNSLYDFSRRLWTIKKNELLLKSSVHLIYKYFVKDKSDFETREVETIIRSVMNLTQVYDQQTNGQYFNDTTQDEVKKEKIFVSTQTKGEKSNATMNINVNGKSIVLNIPKPYSVENGNLYRLLEKKVGGEIEVIKIMVCRQVPVITRSFSNIEDSKLYYEITWIDNGRLYKETVPAGDLAIKRDLLKLANMSLAVTENNAKDLINYFDKFNWENNIPSENLVERLGYIRNRFVHPLASKGVKILPSDIGEKQMLEAFEISGTTDEWITNVFKLIKEHPKAVLMVLSSFTSVLIQELKMKPFIIDLSGVTSQGKTTVLRVAASVWGNEYLVSEWNLTKVAAERKAAFLNSFPLILDDTRKADKQQLQGFIYNFSGGRSKGRGSLTGSQKEFTWNNLMLSTGEDSLNSYAERAGGAAARILPITGLPFEGEDYNFFADLNNSIERYYGSVGLDFLEHWKDKKKTVLTFFDEYIEIFQKKSQGNEVISRIARYYAAIVFTGRLLNEFFDIGIDLMQLYHLFDELNAENKSTDKPLQLLEAILSDLESDRGSIYGQYVPHKEIKAIYKSKTIYLLPAYLKDFLRTEQTMIRSEWLRREISIGRIEGGRLVDYQQIKHDGRKFRGVAIQPGIVEKLGFDFRDRD